MLDGHVTNGAIVTLQQAKIMVQYLKHILLLSLLFLFAGIPVIYAQQEDTTRTERDLEQRMELQREMRMHHTPYSINISPSELERYRLQDKGTQYGFYRRLNHLGPREYFFNQEEHFDPYGPEWERKINEQILAILQAEFGEQIPLLNRLASIARFFTIGFFEPYEVPVVPRFEDDVRSDRDEPQRH